MEFITLSKLDTLDQDIPIQTSLDFVDSMWKLVEAVKEFNSKPKGTSTTLILVSSTPLLLMSDPPSIPNSLTLLRAKLG